jgi:3-dehydroquinate synthetase
MVMAAGLSGIDANDIARLRDLVAAAGLPIAPPQISAADWMAAMGMDKKVQDRKLRFVLLDAIGKSRVTSDYDARRLDELVADVA